MNCDSRYAIEDFLKWHDNSIVLGSSIEKVENNYAVITKTLEEHGVLMLSDLRLPSVVGLIVGEPVHGSWWGHPMGKAIYALANRLEDSEHVMSTKLVAGKVTFVHMRLWQHVVKIGTAREKWQTEKLSESAKDLLKIVDKYRFVETDSSPELKAMSKPGKACDDLEKRLLVYAEGFHTKSGAHAKRIQTWSEWTGKRQMDKATIELQQAKDDLAAIVQSLNNKYAATATLPWQ